MKKPPLIGDLAGGLSPLAGSRAAQLLPRARLGGPMPWVMAIMVALTVLAAGGGLALANLAASARGDLAGRATVQIVDADSARREAEAGRAVTALSRAAGVRAVRRMPQAEVERLVEPWLGSGGGLEAVPLPALIDIDLTGAADAAEIRRLTDVIQPVAPHARIDAQSEWLAPVLGAVRALGWMAAGLIALLVFTSMAAVWLAARNALGANRSTIEVVHHLGGSDDQIARIFQRSILLDAAAGGALGLVLGGALVVLLGAQFAALDSGLVAGGGLMARDWALLAIVPLFAVLLAVYTARMTVLASLRKML